MNLRSRIALLVAGSVAVCMLLVAAIAFISTVHEIERDADRQLSARAERLRSGFGPGQTDNPPLRGLFGPNQPIQVIDDNGTPLLTYGIEEPLHVTDIDIAAIKNGMPSVIHTEQTAGGAYRIITVPLENGGGLMLAENLLEQQEFLNRIQGQFVIIGLIGAAVAGLIASGLAAASLRPMGSLAAAAENVARTQDLDATIQIRRYDEVGRVSSAFNTMLTALAASRSQQKRLIDDASHELRTPLTALRTNIDFLQRADGLELAERKDILRDVNFELEELTTLVSELVELAKDNQTSDEAIMEIELGALVGRVAERAERRYNRAVIVTADDTLVTGRPTLIERAVSNLIDNAHKWSGPDQPIEVSVAAGEVRVRDHGPGISDDDKSRVFDRFYRSDQARTLPGSGLGLAIVHEIVAFHGGTTIVEDAPDGGAIVGFRVAAAS
jgi:two-component system sensor histidine kinase MprB